MLIHHLFYTEDSRLLYDDLVIHGHGLVHELGIFGNVCVAIFVFISGYGLSYKYKKGFGLKGYFISRFKKLYFNYWIIWFLFVPISVFVFNRTFVDVYGSHCFIKAALDFLGLLNLTGTLGYNATWWFYSCIIVLYVLYPFLSYNFEERPFFILTLSLFVVFASFITLIRPWSYFLLPFIAGIYMERKPPIFMRVGKWECIITLILLCVMRNFCGILWFIVDTLICVGLSILLNRIQISKWFETILCRLGKHSMNIFLFHTFIFSYWFKDYVYITRNPILIFFTLLISCYIISVIIEFIKELTSFYNLFLIEVKPRNINTSQNGCYKDKNRRRSHH